MSLSTGTDELVRLVIDEVWNCGELAVADDLFTSDYVNHGGLIPDLVRGPEAIKLSVALYRRAFPDFQLVVDEVTAEESAIVLRWVAHRGYALMNGAGLRKGGLRGITRCRLLNGKIAETWTVWDRRVAVVLWRRNKAA